MQQGRRERSDWRTPWPRGGAFFEATIARAERVRQRDGIGTTAKSSCITGGIIFTVLETVQLYEYKVCTFYLLRTFGGTRLVPGLARPCAAQAAAGFRCWDLKLE